MSGTGDDKDDKAGRPSARPSKGPPRVSKAGRARLSRPPGPPVRRSRSSIPSDSATSVPTSQRQPARKRRSTNPGVGLVSPTPPLGTSVPQAASKTAPEAASTNLEVKSSDLPKNEKVPAKKARVRTPTRRMAPVTLPRPQRTSSSSEAATEAVGKPTSPAAAKDVETPSAPIPADLEPDLDSPDLEMDIDLGSLSGDQADLDIKTIVDNNPPTPEEPEEPAPSLDAPEVADSPFDMNASDDVRLSADDLAAIFAKPARTGAGPAQSPSDSAPSSPQKSGVSSAPTPGNESKSKVLPIAVLLVASLGLGFWYLGQDPSVPPNDISNLTPTLDEPEPEVAPEPEPEVAPELEPQTEPAAAPSRASAASADRRQVDSRSTPSARQQAPQARQTSGLTASQQTPTPAPRAAAPPSTPVVLPPPPAAPAPAAMESGGGLGRGQVRAGMQAVQGRVRACGNGQSGRVSVSVRIAPSGRVAHARVEGYYASRPEGSCIARAVRGAQFPAFDGPTLTIRYQFSL